MVPVLTDGQLSLRGHRIETTVVQVCGVIIFHLFTIKERCLGPAGDDIYFPQI